MLAYEAIYNVSSPLHPIWLDSHARAMGDRNASYWRRFNTRKPRATSSNIDQVVLVVLVVLVLC
jgi:hypothetical protein